MRSCHRLPCLREGRPHRVRCGSWGLASMMPTTDTPLEFHQRLQFHQRLRQLRQGRTARWQSVAASVRCRSSAPVLCFFCVLLRP
eukprot:UN1546